MTKNALLEKGPKNSGMGRPPLIWAMPERKRFFFIDVLPKADLFSQISKWSYVSVQITAYKDLWRACTFSPSSTPLKAPKGPPYTNLLVLHRRFTARLETLLERKSEGCVFVEGGRPHDLAAFDILVIEKENETLRGSSKFCECPPVCSFLRHQNQIPLADACVGFNGNLKKVVSINNFTITRPDNDQTCVR